jgi:hypothetical protein
MLKQTIAILALFLIPLASVGCCDKKPIKYNITVDVDEEMRKDLAAANRKLEVHLVGINENQHQRWNTYSMTKYWQPGDTLPNSLPTKKMMFDPANPAPQKLSIDDPIWNKWLKEGGANRVYVLALLPGMVSDAEGDKDPRRQILPLPCYRWLKQDKKIDVRVQKTGVTTLSMSRPER